MKEPKSISRSIRMTETVYDYVSGHVGDGFNQKFENLCHRFMREEAELVRRIGEKKKLLAELDEMASAIKQGLHTAKRISVELECTQDIMRRLVDECDSFLPPAAGAAG